MLTLTKYRPRESIVNGTSKVLESVARFRIAASQEERIETRNRTHVHFRMMEGKKIESMEVCQAAHSNQS
jgi:hypothetical protein